MWTGNSCCDSCSTVQNWNWIVFTTPLLSLVQTHSDYNVRKKHFWFPLGWRVNTGRLVSLLRFNEFFWTKSKWNSNVFRGAIGVARSDVVSRVSEILPSTCATLAAGAAPPSSSVRPEWIFFCFFKKSMHLMLLHTIDDFFLFK